MQIDPVTDGMQLVNILPARPGLKCWELKDGNVHRGVISISYESAVSFLAIRNEVRSIASRIYRPSWWRGFAFGSIVFLESSPTEKLQSLSDVVDSFNNSKGVWQWVVAVDHQRKKAFACHMWAHGMLHSGFEKTVAKLTSVGYVVETVYKEQPRFFSRFDSALAGWSKFFRFLFFAQIFVTVVFGFLWAVDALSGRF